MCAIVSTTLHLLRLEVFINPHVVFMPAHDDVSMPKLFFACIRVLKLDV